MLLTFTFVVAMVAQYPGNSPLGEVYSGRANLERGRSLAPLVSNFFGGFVRGLLQISDAAYERHLALINRKLSGGAPAFDVSLSCASFRADDKAIQSYMSVLKTTASTLNHPLIFLACFQCVGLRRRLVVRWRLQAARSERRRSEE